MTGSGALAAMAVERGGHFQRDLLHFFRFTGDLRLDFQSHQIGFVGAVFGAEAVAEVALDFVEGPVKRAFGGGFVASEDLHLLLVAFDPVFGIHGHFPLDLFETQAGAFEEPMTVNELLNEGFFNVIGRLILVPPLLVERFIFGRIFVAQDELLGAAAVFGGVLRGDGLAFRRARAGGATVERGSVGGSREGRSARA